MTASKPLSSGFVATPRPLRSQGVRTLPKSSIFRWLWTLRRSHGWKALTTTPSTTGNDLRRSSSTISRERFPVQVLDTILPSASKNVTSFCGPTRVASSTSALPSQTSRRTTSSIASTTAAPTRASTGISGGTGQRLLRAFVI
jgi:hypothetical protein